MKTRTTTCIFLLLLLAAAGVRAQGTQHTFILQVADTILVDAGIETQILVILKNHVTPSAHLSSRVLGDAGFSIDTLYQEIDLDSGINTSLYVRFLSNTGGTFSTLLTVTDGTVTDSVLLTAVVNSNPFVLLPPRHSLYADLGVPIQFSFTILNLTTHPDTVTIQLSGDPGFTYSGPSSVEVPANGSHTVTIQFLGTATGGSSASLLVSNGSYSATAIAGVITVDSPYKWITEYFDNLMTRAGVSTLLIVSLRNTSGAPVTLNISLTGDPDFQLDSTIIMDNRTSLVIPFVTHVEGVHTPLLTVTDGVDIDTVTVNFYVLPALPNIALELRPSRVTIKHHDTVSTDLTIYNRTNLPLTVNASIIGDSRFSIDGTWPVVLSPHEKLFRIVRFSGAAPGEYIARIAISDGDTSLTEVFNVEVKTPHMANSMFEVVGNKDNWVFFAAPPGGTDSKILNIRNLSDGTAIVRLRLYMGSDFVLSTDSLTIDSGMTVPVTVTFVNPQRGRSDAHLKITSGTEAMDLTLRGETTTWSTYSGLQVWNYLDFGMVDTASRFCKAVSLVNTTSEAIAISNVRLSGYSPDFSVDSDTSFSIAAYDSAAIIICYTPTTQVYIDNEVLTFTLDNPAANPRTQSVAVRITGLSVRNTRQLDSIRMIVSDHYIMVAPMGGYVEKTFTMQNLASRPIVLDRVSSNQTSITLLTPPPITLPAFDSTVAGSGRTTIRVRYEPTGTPGSPYHDDMHTFFFHSSDSSLFVSYSVGIFGKPVQPIPGSSVIALYPEDALPPMIALGEAAVESHHILRFRNNLTVPVTITSCGLETGTYAELVDHTTLPVELQPDETISIELKVIATVQALTSDAIILRGSHDILNSRYEIYNGKMTTEIEQPLVRISGFAVHAAPNPSKGNVAIYLNETLQNGRLRIVDVLGRTVAELESAAKIVHWDATANGNRVPAGSYFIHVSGTDLKGAHVTATRKLVLLP